MTVTLSDIMNYFVHRKAGIKPQLIEYVIGNASLLVDLNTDFTLYTKNFW